MAFKRIGFLLGLLVLLAEGVPQRRVPSTSVSIDDAQNHLIGNSESPDANRDCVCTNWRQCADINSDVKCHPDFAFVCCRKLLY